MTGTSFVTCDGNRPTSIIVTFNTALVGPAKLFVNGVLDDSSTGATEQTTSADFTLGGSGTSTYRTTTGLVEEVIIYTKAYEVPETATEYVYNTELLEDSNASSTRNVTHSGRLVVADYHNFRGTSTRTLGMSTVVGWRATTV